MCQREEEEEDEEEERAGRGRCQWFEEPCSLLGCANASVARSQFVSFDGINGNAAQWLLAVNFTVGSVVAAQLAKPLVHILFLDLATGLFHFQPNH